MATVVYGLPAGWIDKKLTIEPIHAHFHTNHAPNATNSSPIEDETYWRLQPQLVLLSGKQNLMINLEQDEFTISPIESYSER